MPPYALVPVIAADREIISTIFCSSYTTNGYFRLQYRGLSIPEMIPGFSLRFPAGKLSRANAWHLKLQDAELDNKTIAFARWNLPEGTFERLNTELKKAGGLMALDGESEENLKRYKEEREQGYVDGEPAGMDVTVPDEAAVDFKKLRAKAEALYPEHIELDALHTLPEHERKGAGTALMEWGTELADIECLPILLLSTSHGVGLYRKFGFKELDQVTFDLTRWDGEGESTWYMMLREPGVPIKS